MLIRTRILAAIVVCVVGTVLFTADELSSQSPLPPGKERINDVPTPGILKPLRTIPAERPSVDAMGQTTLLPSVWTIDPATGAEYRLGEVLVQFTAGVSANARSQALRLSRTSVTQATLPGRWELAQVEAGTNLADAVAALRRAQPSRRCR
jgi:Fervidolysin N-terminal prodomain